MKAEDMSDEGKVIVGCVLLVAEAMMFTMAFLFSSTGPQVAKYWAVGLAILFASFGLAIMDDGFNRRLWEKYGEVRP